MRTLDPHVSPISEMSDYCVGRILICTRFTSLVKHGATRESMSSEQKVFHRVVHFIGCSSAALSYLDNTRLQSQYIFH